MEIICEIEMNEKDRRKEIDSYIDCGKRQNLREIRRERSKRKEKAREDKVCDGVE